MGGCRRLEWDCALAAALWLASLAPAADWPQWRGPDHDGVTSESSGWPSGWPPKRLWDRHVGMGCSSPILAGGKLYSMGWAPGGPRGGTDTLYCLDARSGRELWKQSYPCPRYGRVAVGDQGEYGGPTSTPTLDGATGHVFTLSTDGDLRCWDTNQQGKLLWAKNLYNDYKASQRPETGGGRRDYGYATSPLLRDGLLLVEVGAAEGTVMAFDQRTGQRRWASEYKEPAGHTGGLVPMKVAGADCLAVFTLHHLVVMRLDPGHEGKTLATAKWETEFACNVPTPAAANSRVLVASSYNHKTATLFEVSPKGMQEAWTSPRHGEASSPAIFRDRIFLINDALQCLDLASGKLLWRVGSFGNGSCLATADAKLIVWGAGRLVLYDALADRPHELSRLNGVVPGTCYPHVALADGVLCCKDKDGNLVCFSVRSVPPPPDKTPPGLISAAAVEPTKVLVRFSEPVERASAESIGNYASDGGVKILAAALGDDQETVTLTTSTLKEGVACTLTVTGIRDCAKPPNALAQAAPAPFRFVLSRRVTEGLIALYRLDEGKGTTAADSSGIGHPLDLRLDNEAAAKWVPGGLAIHAPAILETAKPATRIAESCRKTNEITLEAWIKPANTTQDGPARVLSLSLDPYKRNFTLGQEGDRYEVRLRTTRTGENGMNPALATQGGVAARLSHVVYTRAADGKAIIYVNGEAAATGTVPGDLSNWDAGFRFALGNELTNDRPWRGEFRRVALYSRALTQQEVEMSHRAGPAGGTPRD